MSDLINFCSAGRPLKMVAITQPNFAPWLGYFEMVDRVDAMIHLDDVQYPTARDWVNRNKIRSPKAQGWDWISISILHKKSPNKRISETQIAPHDIWLPGMIKKIRSVYTNAPFFNELGPAFFDLLYKEYQSIADLNISVIDWVLDLLELQTPIIRSSNLNQQGIKEQKLIALVKAVGGDFYLANNGSKPYIQKHLFLEQGIGLDFQDYTQPPYKGYDPSLLPPLSILDALFLEGPRRCLEIIYSYPRILDSKLR